MNFKELTTTIQIKTNNPIRYFYIEKQNDMLHLRFTNTNVFKEWYTAADMLRMLRNLAQEINNYIQTETYPEP